MGFHPEDVKLVERVMGTQPYVPSKQMLHAGSEAARLAPKDIISKGEELTLREFIEEAWHIVEPEQPLRWNWHHDVICSTLMKVSSGEVPRLIINVPPGTMKSLLVSVFWPCWEWSINPSLRYLAASYGAHLSSRDNQRVRDIVTSEWYRSRFPATRLKPGQETKTRFDTTSAGWRIGTSVRGAGTGEHPDRIIIDDPHTAEQARSDKKREVAHHWYSRTVSTRGAIRKARVVVIMQRLHEDDMTGRLLKRGGWELLRLPMRYEEKSPDPRYRPDARDPRTEPGQLLWPEMYPEEKVNDLELDLNEYGAAAQLQQRPAPEGGGLFKRAWLPVVQAAPTTARRCRGWDTGGDDDDSDWSVGVLMSLTPNGKVYVEHVWRDHGGPDDIDKAMKGMAKRDGNDTMIREEREPGSSGKWVTAAHVKMLIGYDYEEVRVGRDKVTRARSFRAQAQAGNVFLVEGDWNEEYIQELTAFPVGTHDDQVDASSAAFNALALEEQETEKRAGVLDGF